MEKRYIERLLQEEKYLQELNKMYDEMMSVRRYKRKLEDIEKEVTWYVGNKKNQFLPDYNGFYEYAYKNYISHENNTLVQSRYKALLGEYNVNEIPGYFYCLILLGHLSRQLSEFEERHKDELDEEDYEKLGYETFITLMTLYNKVKLLIGFLEKLDALVAVFVNSMDMAELEYLDDDLKKLDSRALKHRFMAALHKKDKSMTFKLLGRMRELDEGEDYYFEALSHFINEEYGDCLRYLNKVEKSNIDYQSSVALKLECFSLLGDMVSFIQCIEENKHLQFEYWHIAYLMMSASLRSNLFEEREAEINGNIFEQINFLEEMDPYYIGCTYRLVANIVTEGLEILTMIEELSNTVPDYDVPDERLRRLCTLQYALEMFPHEVEFEKYLDVEALATRDCADIKNEAELALLKLLIDQNPEQNFENIRAAFVMQYRMGDIEKFVKNVNENYLALSMYAKKGEKGADELIRMAYVEQMLTGNVDEKIREHVEAQKDICLENDITDKKIRNILSKQGKIAYESAEWQFHKSQEEDYGWKDAGMISLGFYRIIEVELNQKIIIPLLSGIGYEELNSEFTAHANTLSGEAKKCYKNNWGTIMKTYQKMEETNFQGNGFMLGVLDYFFRLIGGQYDPSDSLAVRIRSHLGSVLNSYGITKLDEGFFEEIVNDGTRNKYRNPPAHTHYLPYEIACECREVFQKTILQLGDMLVG